MSSPLNNKSVPAGGKNKRTPSSEVRQKQLENKNEEDMQEMRKKMFAWVKWCVSIYLIVVTVIILIQVFYMGRSLSDNVLIALLVTTTGNVLGLPYLVIKAIFQK